MADGYTVLVDQNLLDQQAEDLLALGDVESFGRLAQTLQEAGQGFGQPQHRGLLGRPIPQGLQFALQALLALTQAGHAAAQVVERQQVLLVGGQQTLHALADTGQLAIQFGLTTACRAVRPGRVEPAVDLLPDQGGVLQQAQHFGPDQVVQQILADRPVVAGWSGQMAVAVRSQAAVVVDLPRTRPGRGPIQRVAALAARDHALQQGRLDGAAR